MRQKAGITYYPPSLKNDNRGMNLASSFLLFSFFFLLLLLLAFPFSSSFPAFLPLLPLLPGQWRTFKNGWWFPPSRIEKISTPHQLVD